MTDADGQAEQALAAVDNIVLSPNQTESLFFFCLKKKNSLDLPAANS